MSKNVLKSVGANDNRWNKRVREAINRNTKIVVNHRGSSVIVKAGRNTLNDEARVVVHGCEAEYMKCSDRANGFFINMMRSRLMVRSRKNAVVRVLKNAKMDTNIRTVHAKVIGVGNKGRYVAESRLISDMRDVTIHVRVWNRSTFMGRAFIFRAVKMGLSRYECGKDCGCCTTEMWFRDDESAKRAFDNAVDDMVTDDMGCTDDVVWFEKM